MTTLEADLALIRRAASRMRENAEAATSGPWHHVADVGIASRVQSQTLATTHHPRGLDESYADAEHIASWHPIVALAVADWLEFAAKRPRPHGWDADDLARAVTVARAYLGEEEA